MQIHSYSPYNHSFKFDILDASRNWPNETVELIVNRSMIHEWLSNFSFSSYYNICAPFSCTFQYERSNTLFFAITTIASFLGGLSLGFQLIILIGLQVIDKIMMNGFSRRALLLLIKHIFTCGTEQRIIRRLHFLLVIGILCFIYMFSTFDRHITIVKTKTPSLFDYNDLVTRYNDSLQCPCSQISIEYKSFLNITPSFHQVYSSNFVSIEWLTHLYGHINDSIHVYEPTDFYYSAAGQFQLLASFCKLSQEIVNDSLLQLRTTDFINTQLLPLHLLEERIQTTINEYQLTMPNLFVNTLSLIRETTGANMLISLLSTSWVPDTSPNTTINGTIVHNIPLSYQGCSCSLSPKCVYPSGRMLTGCYALEAILQSTLACFYDQQCINSTNKFKAMTISLSSSNRFPINTTVESIINELMVEEFLDSMSYESYFNECAPLSCTYSYANNTNIMEGITTLIGLYGGLLIIYRLLAIFIVKQLTCVTSRVTPTTD